MSQGIWRVPRLEKRRGLNEHQRVLAELRGDTAELTTSSAMRSRKLTWVLVGWCGSQSYSCGKKQHLQVHDCGQLINVIRRRGGNGNCAERSRENPQFGCRRWCYFCSASSSLPIWQVMWHYFSGRGEKSERGMVKDRRRGGFLSTPPLFHFMSVGYKTAEVINA